MRSLPNLRHEARLLTQLIRSNAVRGRIAADGVIQLPGFLRRLVHLDGSVLTVAAEDHLELWSPIIWQKQHDQADLAGRAHVVA